VKEKRPVFKAVIVGDGPHRRELMDLTVKYGLHQNVELAGFQEDVAAWLERARILVLPSQTEGLPMVVLEAMSRLVPAVVFDISNMKDILIHEHNAMLARPFDLDQFAAYCVRLLEDGALYESCRENCRTQCHKIRPLYTRETIQQNWEDVLSKVDG